MSVDLENDIRIAGPEDYQEVFRIACLLHNENGQHSFSEIKVKEFMWLGCNRVDAMIGVIGPPTNLKAMIYLQIQPIFYSDEFQLGEVFNYVRPDARKSDYAKRMILFAKKCADDTGLDLMIGVISDKRLEAKKRLYQRLLPEGGIFFNYRPKSKEQAIVASAA